MKKAVGFMRRVMLALAVVGAIGFSGGLLSGLFSCESGADCVAASLVGYEIGYDTAMSTPANGSPADTFGYGIMVLMQAISSYLILISLLILVVLELFDLHYTRKLLRRERFGVS